MIWQNNDLFQIRRDLLTKSLTRPPPTTMICFSSMFSDVSDMFLPCISAVWKGQCCIYTALNGTNTVSYLYSKSAFVYKSFSGFIHREIDTLDCKHPILYSMILNSATACVNVEIKNLRKFLNNTDWHLPYKLKICRHSIL